MARDVGQRLLRDPVDDELGVGRQRREVGRDLVGDGETELPPLSPEAELVVYRVAQEALTNVARHSASSSAELRLARDRDRLVLTVRDHGVGLRRHTAAGSGIRGMRERAALIGATLTVANHRPGPGCEVRLEVAAGDEQ